MHYVTLLHASKRYSVSAKKRNRRILVINFFMRLRSPPKDENSLTIQQLFKATKSRNYITKSHINYGGIFFISILCHFFPDKMYSEENFLSKNFIFNKKKWAPIDVLKDRQTQKWMANLFSGDSCSSDGIVQVSFIYVLRKKWANIWKMCKQARRRRPMGEANQKS